MPAKSVQTIVTSPPYWGLRDYGTAEWEGGSPTCDHLDVMEISKKSTLGTTGHSASQTAMDVRNMARRVPYKGQCKKCGANRIDQQIGSEPTPEEFVAVMVQLGRELRRVLRDDGTFWLNLGDTYGGGSGETRSPDSIQGHTSSAFSDRRGRNSNDGTTKSPTVKSNLKPGNLVGIPWRVALALQADGWVLRQDIIWHKPSPMPESVKNRCTKAHEYIFLLTKSNRYYYDAEAIKEDSLRAGDIPGGDYKGRDKDAQVFGQRTMADGSLAGSHPVYDKKNKRSVWTVATFGYPGAHFATFPPKLIEPCILAGTSEKGACAKCGSPWQRVVEEKQLKRPRPNDYVKSALDGTGNSCANSVAGVLVVTKGWEPACQCGTTDTRPCIVLDPFIGSGTTAAVCASQYKARWAWGIDLSEKYLVENAIPRIEEALAMRS